VSQRGARGEIVAARAGDGDLFVLRVSFRFHGTLDVRRPGGRAKGRGSLAAESGGLKHFGRPPTTSVAKALGGVVTGGLPAWTQAFHYPQNLWITLWIQRSGTIRFPA
jgi:hypothetical protein